jgi:hypothetical protein
MLSNKKTITGLLALFTLVVIGEVCGYDSFAIGVEKVWAQGVGKPSDNIYTTMTGVMAMLIALLNTLSFIVYPILIAVVDPRFFLGIHQANEATILQIWQMSRDIMNVIFAFLLIAGACLTVVTAKKDIVSKFAIKFVLGIILVNFSWFFPRVILDVAHVLTASIYQLPGMVSTTCRYVDEQGNIQTPCEYPYDFKFFDEAQQINDAGAAALGYKCPLSTVCYKVDALSNTTNTATGMLSGLIINHAHLPHLALVQNFNGGGAPPTDPGDLISFFLQFLVNSGFLIVMSIALALVMIAMLVAFVIRIPVLWITMAFMPFMFLGFVIGEKMGNFNTMKIFDHFVKAAFLPAVTAIPLAVGFIVLNALAFNPPPAGLPPGMADILAPAASMGQFLPGVDNLWLLMWNIMTILIIWKGFFAALAIDSIYTDATSGIKSLGGNLAGLAVSAPLNLPIIPAKTNADGSKSPGLSLGQALQAPGAAAGLSRRGSLNMDSLKSQLGLGANNKLNQGTINVINNLTPDRNGGLSSAEISRLASELAKDSSLKGLSGTQRVERIQKDLDSKGIRLSPDGRSELIRQIDNQSGRGQVRTPPPPSTP